MSRPVAVVLAALLSCLGAAGPARAETAVRPGCEVRTLARGLSRPVDGAWAPDGRMFVAVLTEGAVYAYNPGSTTPVRVVDLTGGLYSVGLDKDFATNGWVYLVRNVLAEHVTRITVRPDNTVVNPSAPETTILGRIYTRPCPAPSNTVDCIPNSGHDLDEVRADPVDGTLWVSVGDTAPEGYQTLSLDALDEQAYAGKLLH